MVFIYAFTTFLFYKITASFMFDRPLTIIASLLIAIVSAGFVLTAQMFAARKIDAALMTHPISGPRKLSAFGVSLLPFAVATALTVGVGFLIAVGFSERFARSVILHDRDEWMWLALMLAIPPGLAWFNSAKLFDRMLKRGEY